MSREEALEILKNDTVDTSDDWCEALDIAIKALEQEPCDDVCEWFEQYVDIATDIVELRFSDGTVKRAKRGLYMRDIEKSIRKMLIDQMANEKKQEPCEDCVSRQAVLDKMKERDDELSSICPKDIRELPPVTPQPKMGQWKRISMDKYVQHAMAYYRCSECGRNIIGTHNYCPSCGAKMQSVEEVEE